MIDLIRRLVESYGPSGHEDQIRALILEEIDGLADDVTVDPMGSVIAWRRSGRRAAMRVMLSAHMDEIGVMVTHVDKEGFLRFTNIGGLGPISLVGNRVPLPTGPSGDFRQQREDTARVPTMAQLYIDASCGDEPQRPGQDAAGMARERWCRAIT
jgi:endoglucanase